MIARARLVRHPQELHGLPRPLVATLGNFDGLHLGHVALLRRLVASAQGVHPKSTPLVLSFSPHPAVVLGHAEEVPQITTLRQSLELYASLGVRAVLLLRFSRQLSEMSAREFVEEILVKQLDIHTLVVGPDARIGRGREGDVDMMQRLLADSGRSLLVEPFVQVEGEKIGSRLIRNHISSGNVATARALLGRPFRYEGRVVRGEARGRGLGFPTANIAMGDQVLPANGVYVTETSVHHRSYASLTNIGVRPTFGGVAKAIESHLLDYEGGELYGTRVEVNFIDKLRDEMRFGSVQELKTQIASDVAERRARG